MYLDIHALHTLPYSNVNRDGLGSPKSCIYGGAQRIRVSSQSWKRAARLAVENQAATPTLRTRQLAVKLTQTLLERNEGERTTAPWDNDDARRAGRAIVQAYGLTPEDDADITKVLLWLPSSVIEQLVQLAEKHRELITQVPLPEIGDNGRPKTLSKDEKTARDAANKAIVSALKQPVTDIIDSHSPTIALLGRMLADYPDHTVDGATQVAHAFTVHEAAPDFDYFTAVDDLAPNSGAGHLATAEFAAGTFYRYCTVNVPLLQQNLGNADAAIDIIAAWTRNFLTVVPSGKQNSTAAHTVPDLVYLTLRKAPLSLAAGFERPLTTHSNGYLDLAATTLDDYTTRLHTFLGDTGKWSGYAGTTSTSTPALGAKHSSLDELIKMSAEAIRASLTSEAAS